MPSLISCTLKNNKNNNNKELTCKRSALFCTWLVQPCTSCRLHFALLGSLHSRAAGPLSPLPSSPGSRLSRRSCPALHGSSLPLQSSCCLKQVSCGSPEKITARVCLYSLPTYGLSAFTPRDTEAFSFRNNLLVSCRDTNKTSSKHWQCYSFHQS